LYRYSPTISVSRDPVRDSGLSAQGCRMAVVCDEGRCIGIVLGVNDRQVVPMGTQATT
jgi:hypothetical protein